MPVPLDVVAVVLAVISLVVSIAALLRSMRTSSAVADAKKEPQGVEDRGGEAPPRKAHVHVAVVGIGRSHRVVVSNLGPGTARHVTLSLAPRGGARLAPLVQVDCDEKLPADLPPGGEISLLATVSTGTGSEFDLRALWINEDGSRETLTGVIVAP